MIEKYLKHTNLRDLHVKVSHVHRENVAENWLPFNSILGGESHLALILLLKSIILTAFCLFPLNIL